MMSPETEAACAWGNSTVAACQRQDKEDDECVEVVYDQSVGKFRVRNSSRPNGAQIVVDEPTWIAFIEAVKHGVPSYLNGITLMFEDEHPQGSYVVRAGNVIVRFTANEIDAFIVDVTAGRFDAGVLRNRQLAAA